MEQKKSPKKDINKKRFQLLEIGFIVSLAFVFLAFQYRTKDFNDNTLGTISGVNLESEITPITYEKQKPEPPKPKIKIITTITEVPDNTKKTDDSDNDFWKIMNTEYDIDSLLALLDKDEETTSVDPVFDPFILQEQPSFKGSFALYIKNNLKFPERAAYNGVDGTVMVEFVVEKDGSITNITIERGVNYDLDKEAKRVVEEMPKWNPGKQMGMPVRVRQILPIKFTLTK